MNPILSSVKEDLFENEEDQNLFDHYYLQKEAQSAAQSSQQRMGVFSSASNQGPTLTASVRSLLLISGP